MRHRSSTSIQWPYVCAKFIKGRSWTASFLTAVSSLLNSPLVQLSLQWAAMKQAQAPVKSDSTDCLEADTLFLFSALYLLTLRSFSTIIIDTHSRAEILRNVSAAHDSSLPCWVKGYVTDENASCQTGTGSVWVMEEKGYLKCTE